MVFESSISAFWLLASDLVDLAERLENKLERLFVCSRGGRFLGVTPLEAGADAVVAWDVAVVVCDNTVESWDVADVACDIAAFEWEVDFAVDSNLPIEAEAASRG